MMKKLLTVLMTIAISLSAMAEVPSLINYQGKLSDKSGTPVNGSKNFTVRIFDAKEGGKQIYEENVGAVAVKDSLYSFGFGETGKSVVTQTEILARTDGEKQVFNYITKHKPILGNVTISGGGLSWTYDAGSSDASKFTVTVNKNSGAMSAIFLISAPDQDTEIKVTYDHNTDGVTSAFASGVQAWLEITVGGETLSPRERFVAVPFAIRSNYSNISKRLDGGIKTLIVAYENVTYRGDFQSSALNSDMSVLWTGTGGKIIRFFVPDNYNSIELKFINTDGELTTGDWSSGGRKYINTWHDVENYELKFNLFMTGKEEIKFNSIGNHTYISGKPKEGFYQLEIEVFNFETGQAQEFHGVGELHLYGYSNN
jgi:hypothetical protein